MVRALAATIVILCFTISGSIRCLHCHSYVDNHTLMALCIQGLTQPAPCPGLNDTHCITSYHKKINNEGKTKTEILWRKCGTASDVHGCAVFRWHSKRGRSSGRVQTTGKNGDDRIYTDQNSDVFEVCDQGCDTDGCMVGTANQTHRSFLSATALLALLALIRQLIVH